MSAQFFLWFVEHVFLEMVLILFLASNPDGLSGFLGRIAWNSSGCCGCCFIMSSRLFLGRGLQSCARILEDVLERTVTWCEAVTVSL